MKKSTKELLGFNDIPMMLIGIPIVSVIVNIMMFGHLLESDAPNVFEVLAKCNVASLFYTALYWLVFRQVIVLLRRHITSGKEIQVRMTILGVAVVVVYFLIKTILHATIDPFLHQLFGHAEPHPVLMTVSTLTVAFMVLGFYEVVYYYNRLQKSKSEKQDLEKAHIQSQLEGLRNQVNPHFLFNSLNTLNYIIPEDPKRAIRFVQQLSKVYRYILEMRERKLICLNEELKFLNAYVFLLKERFEQNLQVEINIPDRYYDLKVVPLSLQILMENSIKHNVISKERPLVVQLYIENEDTLVVKNNLQKKELVRPSTQLGLENIKKRYTYFSNRTVDVVTSATSFIVSIPLLQIANPLESLK